MHVYDQGTVYLTRNETRQLFCRMFVMLKKIEDLFHPILNGITLSVSFVSWTLVVLNARWLDLLWLTQTTTPTKTEQTRAFSQTEPLTLNFCCSLDYARGNESITYFTDLCKPIEHTSMLGKSTHLQVIPQQSTQTRQTWDYRHTTKTSGPFYQRRAGVDFSSRNNFFQI